MMNKLANQCKLMLDVVRLPVAKLCFDTSFHPDDVRETHRRFTSPHPKYKVFGYKQLGVALIDLRRLAGTAACADGITGVSGAATYVSKARRRGYSLAEIDRNDHVDAIHDINTSLDSRQGRPMDASYRDKKVHYETQSHYRYFGVFNKEGKLMAYCNIGRYGNFTAFSQLIGYRNNDGVMHLLVTDIVSLLLRELQAGHGPEFLMYDTFFGAQPGLRQFKTMLGFTPYRVRYSLR
ncbi:hypothetical protein NHH73_19730 [Oxalobacteraceae bacterium OTU3CINTB1]|nr:hypothetical protein NHH73_19730 [Oxalobacteraceae bacterium OTU3CINTB1]